MPCFAEDPPRFPSHGFLPNNKVKIAGESEGERQRIMTLIKLRAHAAFLESPSCRVHLDHQLLEKTRACAERSGIALRVQMLRAGLGLPIGPADS